MNIYNNFKFFDTVLTPQTSNVLSNVNQSQLVLQVGGTATSFVIEVSGRVNIESANFETIGVFNNTDFSTSQSITANGIYTIGIDGYSEIKAEIKSVSGGSVTAFGKVGE